MPAKKKGKKKKKKKKKGTARHPNTHQKYEIQNINIFLFFSHLHSIEFPLNL
jgi:hypothetical protein